MRIHDGGELFGFCPGKATWDQETIVLYRSLIVARTCGIMWDSGSLSEQPSWWVNLLSWFIQKYDHEIFASRARMVLGDGKTKPVKGSSKNGGKSR